MPIVRILLILLALAAPALAQDGARDAVAAREAAQAFRVYVEGVAKEGGRPDLTRPEVAAQLGRVFNIDAFNALPPAQASDLDWLLDWMDAANSVNKLFTRYGSKPGPQPDLEALTRNMSAYEDQFAEAMNFTAFGLIVAIPSLVAFSLLQGRTQHMIDDINETSVGVLNLIVANKDKMRIPANLPQQ